MILYRDMVDGDIPAGLALCRTAGWNQTAEDWRLFLKVSPQGCRVAVDDTGGVKGTVTTVRYGDNFSWVGMLLVDPTMQRRGIGIQLLRESVKILNSADTIKLDATPAGRKVYVQLDFVDEYRLSRMEMNEFSTGDLPASTARAVEKNDLFAIMEMDRRVFGADRGAILGNILKRSPQFAFISEDAGGIKGYGFGRMGHRAAHIGPVVASNTTHAKNVVSAALQNCSGYPVVMDASHHSPEWMQWLISLGFSEKRPFIRMYRGTNAHPGKPHEQFAILGPEFG